MNINWLPTYKLSSNEPNKFVNKNEQSQSYTDRVLYKNNSCCKVEKVSYDSYHDVLGSDHRPVVLTLQLSLPPKQYHSLSGYKYGKINLVGLAL